jgi:hypothetical protein
MTDDVTSSGLKTCPWCAEEIRAEAKKCKFCGEFLSDARPNVETYTMSLSTGMENQGVANATSAVGPIWVYASGSWQCVAHQQVACPNCLELIDSPATGWEGQLISASKFPEVTMSEERPYGQGVHPPEVEAIVKLAALRDAGKISVKDFETARAPLLAALPKNYRTTNNSQPPYSDTMGAREKLSSAGVKTSHGLSCPKCGGTQFTAKRSNTGKVIGFATLGVGGLIAPKSQVKCVTCGLKFKRG